MANVTGYTKTATDNALAGKASTSSVEGIKAHDGTTGGGTRPSGYARVRWTGGANRPTNMAANDVWERDA